jgi:hypothetical protein
MCLSEQEASSTRWYVPPNNSIRVMQFLVDRMSSSNGCQVLSVACQHDHAELTKAASACIITHFAAVTCPPELVTAVYNLEPHPLEHLLHTSQSTVSVRSPLWRCTCKASERDVPSPPQR